MDYSLNFTSLRQWYENGNSPVAIVEQIYRKIDEVGSLPDWISVVPRELALARAKQLESTERRTLPLYGFPFAVKDNIDVAGLPTTAGCPAFAYHPSENATVVSRLIDAGAIVIGKTNLDQFATGLVGVRSPYGACSCVFDQDYISGGSSSGSAVAVASGTVAFSLGTDTAGSGRVPAAFNNIIGLKPTKGLVSTSGIVPACRSLDCVSIFAHTVADAADVLAIAAGFDARDEYSRTKGAGLGAAPWLHSGFRFGVPRSDQLRFFGDHQAQDLYCEALNSLQAIGGEKTEIDFQPFLDAASLLYSGPWVAERLAAIGPFLEANGADVDPVVRTIIEGGHNYSAVDVYRAHYKLAQLRRITDSCWDDVKLLLLPTAGVTYKIRDVLADPITLNSNLGYYTNFVNLLDLAAVALPAGFRTSGLPFGVSLVGPAWMDDALLQLADRLDRFNNRRLGALERDLYTTRPIGGACTPPGCTLLAVVGAHLTGEPLNYQLTSRGAFRVMSTRSAKGYKLYALPDTIPPKPGLVKFPGFDGEGVELEVWAMPTAAFGSFAAEVPAPLGIGTVQLADGAVVKGFICEQYATAAAQDITAYGGWRAYRRSAAREPDSTTAA